MPSEHTVPVLPRFRFSQCHNTYREAQRPGLEGAYIYQECPGWSFLLRTRAEAQGQRPRREVQWAFPALRALVLPFGVLR